MRVTARIAQITNWLRVAHPTPFPVRVRWHSRILLDGDECDGVCWAERRDLICIELSRARNRRLGTAVDTLFHEWAHAMCVTYHHVERTRVFHHDEMWGIHLARLVRDFDEDGGCEDSRRYPTRHQP